MIVFKGQDVRFCLDVETGELKRGEERIHVPRQEWELLRYLAERPGKLVSHDELIQKVWGGRNVNNEAVSRSVHKVRRVLGDNPAHPSFIEVVPRRGCRFIAAIEPDTQPANVLHGTPTVSGPVRSDPETPTTGATGRPPSEVVTRDPFRAVVEIVPDFESDVMEHILQDIEQNLLRLAPPAFVDGANSEQQTPSTTETLSLLRASLRRPTRTARRILEWNLSSAPNHDVSVVLTSVGRAVFLYQITSIRPLTIHDYRATDLEKLFETSGERFEGFTSLYDDIFQNLNRRMSGELLPQIYCDGYRSATIPTEQLAHTRLIALLVEKVARAAKPLKMSELATSSGRAVLAHDDSLPLVYRFWLVPLGDVTDIRSLLDVMAMFLHDFSLGQQLAPAESTAVAENLRRLSKLLGSSPIGNGVFESMIDVIDRRSKVEPRRHARQSKRRRRERSAVQPEKLDSLIAIAEALKEELEIAFDVDLEVVSPAVEAREKYTALTFSYQFIPSERTQISGPPPKRCESLCSEASRVIATIEGKAESEVHSVVSKPCLFTDAIAFFVKVNWSDYEGSGDIDFLRL